MSSEPQRGAFTLDDLDPPSVAVDPFDQLDQEFKTQFGRPLRFTGRDTPVHIRLHGKAGARDIGSKELSEEEAQFVLKRGSELKLKMRDFRQAKPHTTSTGVRITGPHIHGERMKEPAKGAFTLADLDDSPGILVKPAGRFTAQDLGQESAQSPVEAPQIPTSPASVPALNLSGGEAQASGQPLKSPDLTTEDLIGTNQPNITTLNDLRRPASEHAAEMEASPLQPKALPLVAPTRASLAKRRLDLSILALKQAESPLDLGYKESQDEYNREVERFNAALPKQRRRTVVGKSKIDTRALNAEADRLDQEVASRYEQVHRNLALANQPGVDPAQKASTERQMADLNEELQLLSLQAKRLRTAGAEKQQEPLQPLERMATRKQALAEGAQVPKYKGVTLPADLQRFQEEIDRKKALIVSSMEAVGDLPGNKPDNRHPAARLSDWLFGHDQYEKSKSGKRDDYQDAINNLQDQVVAGEAALKRAAKERATGEPQPVSLTELKPFIKSATLDPQFKPDLGWIGKGLGKAVEYQRYLSPIGAAIAFSGEQANKLQAQGKANQVTELAAYIADLPERSQRTVANMLLADAARGIGAVASLGGAPAWVGKGMSNAGDELEAAIKTGTPNVDEKATDTLRKTIIPAVASTVAMMVGGRLAGNLLTPLTKTVGAEGVTGLGTMLSSGLTQSGSSFGEAIKGGASPEQANVMAAVGALSGFSERVGIPEMFAKLGTSSSYFKRLLHHLGKELPEEVTQEAGQTVLGQLGEKATYKPGQEIGEGLDDAVLGAAAAALLFASGAALQAAGSEHKSPTPAISDKQWSSFITRLAEQTGEHPADISRAVAEVTRQQEVTSGDQGELSRPVRSEATPGIEEGQTIEAAKTKSATAKEASIEDELVQEWGDTGGVRVQVGGQERRLTITTVRNEDDESWSIRHAKLADERAGTYEMFDGPDQVFNSPEDAIRWTIRSVGERMTNPTEKGGEIVVKGKQAISGEASAISKAKTAIGESTGQRSGQQEQGDAGSSTKRKREILLTEKGAEKPAPVLTRYQEQQVRDLGYDPNELTSEQAKKVIVDDKQKFAAAETEAEKLAVEARKKFSEEGKGVLAETGRYGMKPEDKAEAERFKAASAEAEQMAQAARGEGKIVGEEPARVPGVAGVVKRAREGERRAQAEGAIDKLTGLQNQGQWKGAQPRIDADPNQHIVRLDVNDLKALNDTQGHEAGDAYIQQVGKIIKEEATKAGISERSQWRTGGDEFTLAGNQSSVKKAAIAIRARIAKEVDLPGGTKGSIAVGLGATEKMADRAMYGNKREGKKSVARVTTRRPEEGLTPEGAGVSNEELARDGTFYKVSKSGALTYMGKQADATLKPGEATIYRKADGTLETYAGDPSIVGKYGSRITEAAAPAKKAKSATTVVSFEAALSARLNEKRQSKAEQLKQRIREERGAPKLYQEDQPKRMRVKPGKPGHADYAGEHAAPMSDSGNPGYDVSVDVYPEDIYGPNGPRYYGDNGGDARDQESISIIRSMRNHPDKLVRIYRAVPKDAEAVFNVGDWVTINRSYAKDHGQGALNNKYRVISKVVHARDIWTNGDSLHEWGYDPQEFTPASERPDKYLPGWMKKKSEKLFQADTPQTYDEINLPEDIKRPLLEIAQSFIAEGNTDYAKLVSNFETLLGGDFEYVIDALPIIVQHAENLERLRTAPSDKIDLAPGEATEKAVATGKTSRAVTPRGIEVRTRFALFESDQPITSHDIELRPNPHFPEGVQNRDRAKVSSEDDLNEKIRRFEPEYLGRSIEAGRGAPIMGPDMAVESGNGRVIMLRRIYREHPVDARKYRSWLEENAARFGMTRAQVEAMNQPILAQVRLTALSPVERIQFAEQANEDTQLKLSPVEVARGDSRKLSPGLIAQFKPGADGDMLAAGNREFVKGFLDQVVGPSRGDLLTSSGEMNQNGVDRVRNAIFARAYADTDAGVQALEKLSEETDVNTRRVIAAMVAAAPRFVELKQMITGGGRYALDLSPDLAEAARQLSLVRESGVTVDEFLRQGQLFGENLSRVQKKLLWTLNENARSATKLSQVLTNYLDAVDAIGDPRQQSFFSENVPTKEEILEAAVKRLSDADQSNIGSDTQKAIGGAREGLFAERPAPVTREEAAPASGLPSVVAPKKEATPTKPVIPTDRASFKRALISEWNYEPEVAHRTAEVMEALASSYVADLKAANPKTDTTKAKRAFYESVRIAPAGDPNSRSLAQHRDLADMARDYDSPEAFAKDFKILFHGGSEQIIGDKLVTGGRVAGEVTAENLGRGQDYGGIFFTPEMELARTFERHAPGGKGGVHTFLVRTKDLFDERKAIDRAKLKAFIGKTYTDIDGETVEFTQQMYDFVFPQLDDKQRHMDWATFDGDILRAIGYQGANVVEHFGAYGEGKHLYTTVLFAGGKESPHWRVANGTTIKDAYEQARAGTLKQGELASTEFTQTGEAIIRAGRNPNASSAIHEIKHAVNGILFRLAAQPNAPASLKEAVRVIETESMGLNEGEFLPLHQKFITDTDTIEERARYRQAQESDARKWEGYFREGNAPSSALKSAFAKFKEWLSQIYQKLRPDMELTDSVRRAFDRILGGEKEQAALLVKEDEHFNFRRSSFASPEVEARFRMIVRDAVVAGGTEHKVLVSRADHLERVAALSPDLIPEVKRLRESQIASREIFTAATQYAQTLVNQAQTLRAQITPTTLPDEVLALEDRIAAIEHDAEEILSHTVGVRSEFGRNLALLAAQKTDQLSPERVLAVGKAMAKASGMAEDSRTWRTAARKLVGLSNETQSAQDEKKRIQTRKKGVEDGTIRPPGQKAKREPWQSVMLSSLKSQAKEASARLQEQFGKRLYQLAGLTSEELDQVRTKFESLKKQAAGRPIKTVVDEYVRQLSLFGSELSPAQQGALMELASPTRRAPLSVEQASLFDTSPTVESRREQSQIDKAGPSNLLFQDEKQPTAADFERFIEEGEIPAGYWGNSEVIELVRGTLPVVHYSKEFPFNPDAERRPDAHQHAGLFVYPQGLDGGGGDSNWQERFGWRRNGNEFYIDPRFVVHGDTFVQGEIDGVPGETVELFIPGKNLKYLAESAYEAAALAGGAEEKDFEPVGRNILLQQEPDLPALAHDIATILAARVAEESQAKGGLPLDRILEEMRSAFPDVIGQHEEQIKATADSLLKDARRQALVSAARDPETQVSARRQLALDVADSKRLERQTQEAVDQKRRQIDRIWEREAAKAEKEAAAAWDKSNTEWHKAQEETVAQGMLAELQREQAFKHREVRRAEEKRIEAEKISAEEAKARLAKIDAAQTREREQINEELKAEAAAQKQFERDQRAAVLEEAKRVTRAALEAEHARLQDIADEARAQMKADREAAREAVKSGVGAEARARRKAEREQAAREGRWDYPITIAAREARERIAQVGYAPTVEDIAAIAAGMRIEEGRTASPYQELVSEFGEFYRKNAVVIRNRAAAMLSDARSEAIQRRRETAAAGRAEGVTRAREKAQAREDYLNWQAEELARLTAEEAWQDKRIRTAKAGLAKEFAKLNKLPWWETAMDILSLPRSLITVIDLPHFRQGMPTLFNHPKVWVESLIGSASTWTEAQMDAMVTAMENRPLTELAMLSGLKLAGLESRRRPLSLIARQEEFQNRIAQMFPHVRLSERQYTIAMDIMRSRVFELHAEPLLAKFPPALHPEMYSEIARIVNILNGVGDLGRATQYTPILNRLVFFATRFMAARFQLIGMLRAPLGDWAYRNQPWEVRRIAAKEAYLYAGKMSLLFALAHALGITSFDVDDDDFLKLNIPGTNQKWDITGGVGGYVKTLIKIARSSIRLGTGKKEFKGDSLGSTIVDFARGKLAPAPAVAVDLKMGSQITGEPVTWQSELAKNTIPMIAKDVYEAVKIDGARGLVMVPYALLGGNVSAFRSRKMPDRTGSEAERYATGFLREKMGSTPETLEEYKRRTLITELTAAKKAGRPTDRIEADIVKAGGPLTRREQESLDERIGQTPLERAYPHLSEEQKQAVLDVASPTERALIEPTAEAMKQRLKQLFQTDEYKSATTPERAEMMRRVAQVMREGKNEAETELNIKRDTVHDRLVERIKSAPEFKALSGDDQKRFMSRFGQGFSRQFRIDKDVPEASRTKEAEKKTKLLELFSRPGADGKSRLEKEIEEALERAAGKKAA